MTAYHKPGDAPLLEEAEIREFNWIQRPEIGLAINSDGKLSFGLIDEWRESEE